MSKSELKRLVIQRADGQFLLNVRLADDIAEILSNCQHEIPSYAYGDNEAACDMANRLDNIRRIADNLLRSELANV